MAIVEVSALKAKFEPGDSPGSSDFINLIDTLAGLPDASAKQDVVANVTSTEIGYLDGVTSSIQTQIDTKAPLASPTFTGTVSGVTKTHVSLGNVDNTSDASKPVSTATQTALDLKLDSATAATTYATVASPTFTGTVSGITKTMVGLGSVDNTTDAAKPISTATQTALDLKLASATAATTYETITNVALKAPLAAPTFTGTVSGITATMVGLGNVDNTSDTNKPVSTAQAAAIATAKSETITQILGAGVPEALNTLDELAAALGDDANYAATITTSLGLKAPLASPTLVTPVLGVATATSINGTTIPSTKTLVVTTDTLAVHAATTSAQLAGVISDETGSGALVFANTPTLVTPVLGSATGTSVALTVASGTTVPLTIQNNGTGNSFVVNDVASDTTPFVIDNSGLVGIGTSTTSSRQLTVDGNTAIWGSMPLRLGEGSNTYYYDMGRDSTTGSFIINGNQSGANAIVFQQAGTARMTIDTAGNVGIGTASPSYTLDVAGTTGQLRVTSSTGTNQTRLQVSNTGGSFQFGIDSSTGNNFGLGNYSRVIWNDGAYPLVFTTNSAERMRITSTGNVGIGTASPANTLVVAGGVGEWRFNPSNITVGSNSSGYGTTFVGGVPVDTNTASGGAKMFLGGEGRGDSGINAVIFYANATERFRIASDGAATTSFTTTTDKAVRNTYMSTSSPSGGADGDVWIKYTA